MVGSTTSAGARGGLTDKQRAILSGALEVFARDGYSRASIDAIAAAATVSTRTIYNHFGDKARLFAAVIQESATQVADAQVALIDRYLWKVTDLEADLVDFGRAWATPMPNYAVHWALVRQVNAEVSHIPPAAIDLWQMTGPLRVRAALGDRLRQLAEQGRLSIEDPDRAALHLSLLVSVNNPSLPGARLSAAELDDMVTSGVRAFLRGYGR